MAPSFEAPGLQFDRKKRRAGLLTEINKGASGRDHQSAPSALHRPCKNRNDSEYPMTTRIRAKPRGVFFDLYGTLLVFGDMKAAWSDWIDAFYMALGSCGLAVSKEVFAERCNRFFGREEPPGSNDGFTVFERRIQNLVEGFGLAIPAVEIKAIGPGIVNAWQKHIRPDPEAANVLGALQRTKTLALISNFDHPPHVYRVLREQGLHGYFKTVVISGEVGWKKPHPRIFKLALHQAGLSAEEVIYVGDTEEDVKGAKAAGITPILIARSGNSTDPRFLDYQGNEAGWGLSAAPRIHGAVTTIASLRELVNLVI